MPETVTFDHYEVLTRDDGSLYELGRGAMGITYKAFDTNLRIPVALKVINATFLNSEVARQRFIREARSAAKLRHRNVASVFHLGTDSDAYFYAMEFIDGETVEALIKRQGPLTPMVALQIASQVARALNAAQPHGLVHRDIKPANLMLVREDDDLAVKVIDFGLAKSSHPSESEDESATVSMAGFVGTPHFASPEQLDEKEIDVRSDIYSLGVTLWYMLAGQAPFAGSMAQVMSQHLSKPPPFEKLSETPPPLAKLLARMLEKDPAGRPQTPAELRREIDECLEQLKTGGSARSPAGNGAQDLATIFETTAAPEKSETRFKVGAVIAGRYRIVHDLGETNTGHLFHGQQSSPERPVRLLLLNREMVEDAAAYTKLEKDVQRVAAATHPNLLQTYAIETMDYESFMVSEWTEGFSLLELLRARRELRAAEVLLLLPQAADGIDHARRAGLRKLDLALHQVFVHFPAPGVPKEELLRRAIEQWPTFLLKLNPLAITRDLGASETWAGRQTIVSGLGGATAEGDEGAHTIQSLAAIVYELLGGTLSPFALKAGGSHRYTPIATLSEAGNDVLRRALDPRAPFATAYEFYSALSGVGGLEVERQETKVPSSVPPAAKAVVRPRVSPPTAPRPPRRQKVPMKFFGGLLTIAAIAGAMYYYAKHAAEKKRQEEKVSTTQGSIEGRTTNRMADATATTDISTTTIKPQSPRVPPETMPPVIPPPPTRDELLKTAVAQANELEEKKDWTRAIEAWLRIAEEFPEGAAKMRLEILFHDFLWETSDRKKEKDRVEINPRDLPAIQELAVRAAQLSVVSAMSFLGESFQATDIPASLRWYSVAAEKGDVSALTQVGLIYANQHDYAKGLAILQSAADKGDAGAQYALGECYLLGKGLPNKDPKRAIELLREAVKNGNARAMDLLGTCYRDGQVVPKDFSEAFRLFTQASDLGYARATGNLGVLYMNGEGVERDEEKAVALFQEGKEVADNCMYFLALAYETGRGVPRNRLIAAEWYKKAAETGNPLAARWCEAKKIRFTPKKPTTGLAPLRER